MCSHHLHCLLSLKSVEHIFTNERLLSFMVHLISKFEFLFLCNMLLHVVVKDLLLQGITSIGDSFIFVNTLFVGSLSVFDWEWIDVFVIRIRISSAYLLLSHLNKVKGTANWCMSVLEFLITFLLLSLCNLLSPNLLVALLGIFLSLLSHA
jgi:hypothetical protein